MDSAAIFADRLPPSFPATCASDSIALSNPVVLVQFVLLFWPVLYRACHSFFARLGKTGDSSPKVGTVHANRGCTEATHSVDAKGDQHDIARLRCEQQSTASHARH